MRGDGGDVAIVGAGLIGLAIAFELARRGAAVRVYDRAEPGRAASWAAAGMLAPNTEAIEEPAMRDLCRDGLAAYPSFVARVQAAGGLDPHLRLDGIVEAAFDPPAAERLRERAIAFCKQGIAHERWDRERTLAEEPWLGGEVREALVVLGEGHVDNRRLGRALLAACAASGVSVLASERAELICDRRRVLGVRTERGFAPATWTINACGAWAAHLPGVPPEAVAPVRPIKGQMLALAVPDALVRRATWVPGAYLVPRGDGRLLVGATVEHAGFDERVTAAGIRALLDAALSAAPALSGFTVSESWSGLRPGSPDGLPYLGETPLRGYLLATGHFRNGVLLAAITARRLADLLEGRAVPELAPFGLSREKTAAAPARTTAT